MRIRIFKYFFVLLFLVGCNYSNFTIKSVEENNDFYNYYVFNRSKTPSLNQKLILYLDGSSLHSSLGIKGKILPFRTFSFAYPLQKYFPRDFDILVTENKNISVGEDFTNDTLKLSYCTLKNRVNSSLIEIDSFLDSTSYNKIYLLGFSEGGMILPKVYNNLRNKQKISKIVAISSGGFSYNEILQSYVKHGIFDSAYVDSALISLKKYPNSTEKYTFGNPNKKWKDFLHYNPTVEYKGIDIPILLIHGNKDLNAPVESSRYLKNIFDSLGKHNLEYIEVNEANHIYDNDLDFLFETIVKWLNK